MAKYRLLMLDEKLAYLILLELGHATVRELQDALQYTSAEVRKSLLQLSGVGLVNPDVWHREEITDEMVFVPDPESFASMAWALLPDLTLEKAVDLEDDVVLELLRRELELLTDRDGSPHVDLGSWVGVEVASREEVLDQIPWNGRPMGRHVAAVTPS